MSANSQNPEPTAALDFDLRQDTQHRLILTLADGTRYVDVETVRCFPISDPNYGVAIRDGSGEELVFIDRLDILPSQVRELVESDLAEREFLPVIKRIARVRSQVFPADWELETDRGRITIKVSSEEDVRRLGPHSALVCDSIGIFYQIPDIRTLDAPSRRLLERFV